MAEQSTFIKIDRNIERWRWWKNGKTLHVFLWLLLHANVSDHEFEDIIVHRGQVVASYGTIGKSIGLSFQETRTAILHMKSTGEITNQRHGNYQVITIVNYDKYQDKQQTRKQTYQQSINRPSTDHQQQYKNNKNDKNEKKKKRSLRSDSPFGGYERGTDEFRNRSHLLLKPEEGTVDDIPTVYRDGTYQEFDNFADYCKWRNQ